MSLSKEIKFGYGFLLAGIGMPYLIDKQFGTNWGFVVAVICSALGVWLLFAGHAHGREDLRQSGTILAVFLVVIAIGWPGLRWGLSRAKSSVQVSVSLTNYGIAGPSAWAVMDTTKLYPYRDKFKVLLAIRPTADHSVEPRDDNKILKSRVFDVLDHPFEIDIAMDRDFQEHMYQLNHDMVGVDFWMCAFPSQLHIGHDFTFRDIEMGNGTCTFGGASTISVPNGGLYQKTPKTSKRPLT